MARKRAGSIDSDDSTNARAERRAKRTQFLGTRLQGRTDSCYILASALKGESCCECTCCNALAPVILVAIGIQILVPIQAFVYLRPSGAVLRGPLAPSPQGLEPVARDQQERVES